MLLLLFIASCKTAPIKQNRAAYYWKSIFKLSEQEKKDITTYNIKTLYVKYFDVTWDKVKAEAKPIAKIQWKSNFPENTELVPVIYITFDVFKNISSSEINTLAKNIYETVIHETPNEIKPFKFQIDYDWNKTTKEKYFTFLAEFKKLCKEKKLSTTIRMHQYKYRKSSGIPPVDEGMLMYYNFNAITSYNTKNSILNNKEGKEYVITEKYPLKLDIAIPIFSWGILFSKKNYKGLIRNFSPNELNSTVFTQNGENNWLINKDTTINKVKLTIGNEIRYEYCSEKELKQAAEILKKTYNKQNTDITLYHLDEKLFNQYESIETIYNYFNTTN